MPTIKQRPARKKSALDALIEDFVTAKRDAKIAQDRIAAIQEDLLPLLSEEEDERAVRTLADGHVATLTIVRGTRVQIDEDRLKKALGPGTWKTITSVVLDRGKLDAAIKAKEIDPTVIANASEVIPNKPYIRDTVK